MSFTRIVGTGSFLPEKPLSNDELATRVDTSHEWIVSRTSIEARHIAAHGERTSDLAVRANRLALESAGISANEVDLIVVTATTPDRTFSSTACLVQRALGIRHAAAFDLQAVCAGFIYALSITDRLIATGSHQCALVIGADTFSRLLDWNNRSTCVLFGDGAGAVVLRRSGHAGIIASRLHSDGELVDILRVDGSICDGQIEGHPFVQMDGRAVFKTAVRELEASARLTLGDADMSVSDIDCYIPHHANLRIIHAVADRLNVPRDRVVTTVAQQGNTSAASVPLALDGAVRKGFAQPGHRLMLQGVGAGMA